MGRIQQTFVKRVAVELVENYPDNFSTNFDETKENLQKLIDEGVVDCPSKRIRNRLAGSLVNLKRPKKFQNVLAAPTLEKSPRELLKDKIEAARERIRKEREEKKEELDKKLEEAKKKIAKKINEKAEKKKSEEKEEREKKEKKGRKTKKTAKKTNKKTTKKSAAEEKVKEKTEKKEE